MSRPRVRVLLQVHQISRSCWEVLALLGTLQQNAILRPRVDASLALIRKAKLSCVSPGLRAVAALLHPRRYFDSEKWAAASLMRSGFPAVRKLPS